MRKARKKKSSRNKMSRFISSKRLHIFIFALLFGVVGVYLLLSAYARPGGAPGGGVPYAANPPLVPGTCAQGIDIALLIDASGSMGYDGLAKAKDAAKGFVISMQGTPMMFAVTRFKSPPQTNNGRSPFTQDTGAMISTIDAMTIGDSSELQDLRWVLDEDPRPDRPNLIIIISDFQTVSNGSFVSAVKQAGTRTLALVYPSAGATFEEVKPEAAYVTGPNVNTGNVLSSDIITINLDTLKAAFNTFVSQLCNPPPPPPPPCTVNCNPGGGDDGNDNGNNNSGNGNNGTGNNGGGGGGSSATNQGDADNSTPSNSDQGDATEQPKVEPSPFFDGKLFAIGSSAEAGIGNTVGVGGLRVGYGWFYLLGLLVLLGVGGWFGWKKWGAGVRARLKTRLR